MESPILKNILNAYCRIAQPEVWLSCTSFSFVRCKGSSSWFLLLVVKGNLTDTSDEFSNPLCSTQLHHLMFYLADITVIYGHLVTVNINLYTDQSCSPAGSCQHAVKCKNMDENYHLKNCFGSFLLKNHSNSIYSRETEAYIYQKGLYQNVCNLYL